MENWNDLIERVKDMKVGENIVFNISSGIYNLTKTEDVPSEDGKKYQDEELQHCYDKGFDNIKNGSNITNSNYSIFSTKEKLKAWEHGRDDASSETQEGGNNNGK